MSTEDEVEKQRAKVEKLREQVAASAGARDERERELSREIELTQLRGEEARLQAALNESREAAKSANVKAGAADLLEAVKDQTQAAEAAAASSKENS